MFGGITLKCRPLRLAFLIPPNKDVLRTAIQINSTLWGGVFNPIIPLYAQSPKAWKEHPGQRHSMKDRVIAYLRAFDPDFLVDCTGAQLPGYAADLGRSLISVDDIWSGFYSNRRDGAPQYGVGVFELLNGIYKEFFEAVRRFPVKIGLPASPKHHALFWAAVVGEFPIYPARDREWFCRWDRPRKAHGQPGAIPVNPQEVTWGIIRYAAGSGRSPDEDAATVFNP
jgi:hypothetical protein